MPHNIESEGIRGLPLWQAAHASVMPFASPPTPPLFPFPFPFPFLFPFPNFVSRTRTSTHMCLPPTMG